MTEFGCIKDKFDDRDYLMRAYLPMVGLPKKIDYTPKLSPVRDQGQEGTCVGFAASCGMKEYQELLDNLEEVGRMLNHMVENPEKYTPKNHV